MLTVALSLATRPPSLLLSRLTRYHANAAAMESAAGAALWVCHSTAERADTAAAFTLWVLLQRQSKTNEQELNAKGSSVHFRFGC